MQAIGSFKVQNNFAGLCFQETILAAIWRMQCDDLRSEAGKLVMKW